MALFAPFRPRHRLSHAREFRAVYDTRLKKPRGPLIVWACATEHREHRLGLSIGRRVGPAVARNAVKRRLREAFRLSQAEFPIPPDGGGYDLVVGAQPHDLLTMQAYRVLLLEAVHALHREHCRRQRRTSDSGQT
ncbi:MAG: ribonuclease P protein component [Phycisphaeraceae bacterium]|nr:ribonuclease P protein component [Phycisphaeraceae bacterium]MCW5763729.1 ribonuclease P protein component [Phycisphaeraceae bacterium]